MTVGVSSLGGGGWRRASSAGLAGAGVGTGSGAPACGGRSGAGLSRGPFPKGSAIERANGLQTRPSWVALIATDAPRSGTAAPGRSRGRNRTLPLPSTDVANGAGSVNRDSYPDYTRARARLSIGQSAAGRGNRG